MRTPESVNQEPEPIVCQNITDGLSRLKTLGETLRKEKDKVIIVVSGLPGAGKSYLIRQFLKSQISAVSCIGIENLEETYFRETHFAKNSFLIIEEVIHREVADEKLMALVKQSCDIFIVMRDPKSQRNDSFDAQSKVDLIIYNPDTKGQQTPGGHIRR